MTASKDDEIKALKLANKQLMKSLDKAQAMLIRQEAATKQAEDRLFAIQCEMKALKKETQVLRTRETDRLRQQRYRDEVRRAKQADDTTVDNRYEVFIRLADGTTMKHVMRGDKGALLFKARRMYDARGVVDAYAEPLTKTKKGNTHA